MGSLPRQTPDMSAQRFASEPAIVAFRRPTDDDPQADDRTSAASQEEAENLPVLLKLPDVKPRAASTSEEIQTVRPWADRTMWAAAVCLVIVALGLLATGKKPSPPPTESAPKWQPNSAAPTNDWLPPKGGTTQTTTPSAASAQYNPYQQPVGQQQPNQQQFSGSPYSGVERFPNTQPQPMQSQSHNPQQAAYPGQPPVRTAALPPAPRTLPPPTGPRPAEARLEGIRNIDMSRNNERSR